MKFEILKERDMKLLSRKRVSLMIDNKGATPSRLELLEGLAEKFKTKPELIVIKHIYSQYGKRKTKLIVNIYKDKKKMELFEHEDLLKKHRGESVTKEVQEKPPKPTTQGEEQLAAEEAKEAPAEDKPIVEEKPVEEPVAEEAPKEKAPKEEAEKPLEPEKSE